MRTIVNISLPAEIASEVRRDVRRHGFASVSEYFRHLIREEKGRQLLRGLRQSERDFKAGKGKVLGSLAELD